MKSASVTTTNVFFSLPLLFASAPLAFLAGLAVGLTPLTKLPSAMPSAAPSSSRPFFRATDSARLATPAVRLAACIHESAHSAYMSAPVNVGGHCPAMRSSEVPGAMLNLRVSAVSTLTRVGTSDAMLTYASLSKRPGRSSAGSTRSGRLLAPIMKTSCEAPESSPSSSASSWLTTRSITPPESAPPPRLGASASSSSKNRMTGRARRARSKTSRTFFSDSPMYMLTSSGPFTERKLRPHSVATAFATSVLPVPGGPYSSTPERACRPLAKSSGCCSGSCTVSRMVDLTSSRPPTSSHFTLGTLGAPSVAFWRFLARFMAPSSPPPVVSDSEVPLARAALASDAITRRSRWFMPAVCAAASSMAAFSSLLSERAALDCPPAAPAARKPRSEAGLASRMAVSMWCVRTLERPCWSGVSTPSSCVKMRRSAFGMGSMSSAVATSSTFLLARAAAVPSAMASSSSNSSCPASAACPGALSSAAAAAPSGAGGGSRYESSTVPSTSWRKQAITRAPWLASCVGCPWDPAGGTSAWKRRSSSMHGAKSRASSKTSCIALAVAASFWPTSS
mmetsp:Transcript_18815/g.58534  ORF Transcript_18815/g.58534 Transcript_18815/m.58534 type:complete len:565 (+) Transcript_18815:64-1758(+)